MDRFEQRLSELEKKYQADLKARNEEIARLKAIVERQQAERRRQSATRPSPLITLNPENTPGAESSAPTTNPADEIEAAKQAVLRDIETRQAPAATLRVPANFNPNIAVVGDFHGNVSTNNENPARNRWDIASVELDLRAAVDPRADAVVILPVSRDIDDPRFFNPATARGNVDTSIVVEEAYLFLHDFGVPNLTAKLGRYHLRFGRWNVLHAHDWPTVDNAFAVQSFLGPDALEDSGLSLSYVVPPKLIGHQYVTLMHTDPTGRFNNQIFQGELFDGIVDTSDTRTQHSLGAYLLAQQQLNRDWYLGTRLDWTQDALDENKDIWGASAYCAAPRHSPRALRGLHQPPRGRHRAAGRRSSVGAHGRGAGAGKHRRNDFPFRVCRARGEQAGSRRSASRLISRILACVL